MSNKALAKVKRVNSGKKRNETPEGSSQMTPTASTDSGSQERERLSSMDAVLDTEEVAALTIHPEDLIKMHPPRPTSSELFRHREPQQRVFVKEPTITTEMQDKHKLKKVGVLHPLPPGTVVPMSKQLAMTPPGPRFDEAGTFIDHSILGTATDFASELERRKIVKSGSDFVRPPPIVELKVTKPTPVEMLLAEEEETLPKERHALEQWNIAMSQRRVLQQNLAEKMQCYPENLVMSKGDEYRKFQEERTLIDRAIPPLGPGKGNRFGTEFWQLPERLGDEETGIEYTLTKTEKGQLPDVEYIGVPSVVCKEKGLHMESQRNSSVHYTRRKDSYFLTRREELRETLDEMEHYRPDVSELQVIGHNFGVSMSSFSGRGSAAVPSSKFRFRADSLDSLGEEGERGREDSYDTTIDAESITGPALTVGNSLLQWEGPELPSTSLHLTPPSPSTSPTPLSARESRSESLLASSKKTTTLSGKIQSGSVKNLLFPEEEQRRELRPIKCRVLLECSSGEITTSHLRMRNCGTTAVYYSWEPIAKPNPLETVQAGEKQRFYFDTRGGVLLPGEELDFPFYFKSPNPGIFNEMWVLGTSPVLNRGRPLLVILKGVAFQHDLYEERRDQIERVMVHREAEAAAARIVERIVESIRTPPTSPRPRQTVLMEEDIFEQQNPEMYYHYNLVQQLKHLHDVTLCPELFQQETASLTPSSFPTKGEKSSGKKGEEKSGGTKRGGGTGGDRERGTPKEKRGAKSTPAAPPKEEVVEVVPEPPPVEIPKWDLSITSLLKIIMNVEDESLREDKLKQLNQIVGELSFPPLPPIKKDAYHLCYLTLCEAVDEIADMSTRLCQVMGLPSREWEEGGKRGEEHNVLSIPASPVLKKGEKRSGGKDKKDKKSTNKGEREKTPTTKAKKHSTRGATSPKSGTDSVGNETEAGNAVEVDPILDRKYKSNFYASVYRILEQAVDRIVMLIELESGKPSNYKP